MSSKSGKILARRVDEEVCFVVLGRADAHLSPGLRQYAEGALSSGASTILIDLRECKHCDSTFVGTLLRLKHIVAAKSGSLQLVRPSAEVRDILVHMGAQRLFDVIEQLPTRGDDDMTWQELADDDGRTASSRFKRNAAEAHQALAEAGGELATRFGAVAEAMQQELSTAEDKSRQSSGN
jgi:anti-anti-sigma factor